MPRLRDVRSGVVVNVDEDTAAGLMGYEPVGEAKPEPKKAPARRAASKSDD